MNDTSPEKVVLSKIFTEQILVNLRTYETNALVFYANDHLNNFVQLYIENATNVVFSFNHGNIIKNLTVRYTELNSSKPVQIAIVRQNNNTTMYVNDNNSSIPIGVKLLEEYSNKPWSNPEKGNCFFLLINTDFVQFRNTRRKETLNFLYILSVLKNSNYITFK